MYRVRRPLLSAAERAELWAQWKWGERVRNIATALGRASGSVYARVRKTGGIPGRPRQRAARRTLSAAERKPISLWLANGAGRAGDRPGAGARSVGCEPGDRA